MKEWARLGEQNRLENLAAKEPAAILTVPTRGDLRRWAATVDRNLRMPLFPVRRYSKDQPPLLPIPVILLGESAVLWIFADSGTDPLDPGGLIEPKPLETIRATILLDAKKTRTACFNIIGIVKGVDDEVSDEVVVVSAHLDHLGMNDQGVFAGANDNASGCAAILEVMEAIAVNPFRRSVMAVFTTGEEIGHFGSLHFVNNLPVEHRQLTAAVTLEHLGRIESRSDGLEIVATAEFLDQLKNADPWMKDLPVLWGDIEHNRSGKVRGSDTQSFRNAEIPVVLLGGGAFPEYHTPQDTSDKIDLSHLRFSARITYSVVQALAGLIR